MSFPKWRHHQQHESTIVYNRDQEESITPSDDGWRDDRCFEEATPIVEPVLKNKGGRPRKVIE